MTPTTEHNERMAKMTFASVYPHYIRKVESKGRTKEELHQVIQWLTDFDEKMLQELIEEKKRQSDDGGSSAFLFASTHPSQDSNNTSDGGSSCGDGGGGGGGD